MSGVVLTEDVTTVLAIAKRCLPAKRGNGISERTMAVVIDIGLLGRNGM
jgi:hypothetical protein